MNAPKLLILAAFLGALPAAANPLEDELGRSEVRVYAAPFPLVAGRTVWDYALAERLERLGYRRVRSRPSSPGEFFWGNEVFWIFRRGFRAGGDERPARLFGLRLGDRGLITGYRAPDEGEPGSVPITAAPRLDPELLAESLAGDRARRYRLALSELPDRVWQAVLAAEDARFYDHRGVDARSLARALLANARAGKVAQGGSTITQQLIKNRDLTPRRSLGRKASEALRALALEADYDKEVILEAYLNQIYLGHVGGLAVHGLDTAARVYFGKPATRLALHEAALLAGMIQGPNRLAPERHPERARARRDWVLGRLEELGWIEPGEVAAAKRRGLGVDLDPPSSGIAKDFLGWVAAIAEEEAPRRVERGWGVVVETGLDPQVQTLAEAAVREGLDELRGRHGKLLRGAPVSAALVALEPETGAVLAYVGGDPAAPRGGFDRARSARRQPGSVIKPLLLLEAFEACGRREPLHPATRLADERLRLDLPSGPWEPENPDGDFRGIVDVRESLRDSLNVPFVRVARWCGFGATASRLRRAGLEIPADPPPSFALGALEVSPLELARAYAAFSNLGRAVEPRPVRRLEKPKGARIERWKPRARAVSSPETAYLVRDLMLDAARAGTARAAAFDGYEVAAKTGTTSERRDAWLAGTAGGLVTVVWVGRDDGKPLGLTGTQAAAPLWRRFMERAVAARPPWAVVRPPGIEERYVSTATGLLVRRSNRHARRELFRRGALPRRDRFWRSDEPVPVIQ